MAELPGLAVEQLDIDPGTSLLDLSLYLTQSPDALSSGIRENSDSPESSRIPLHDGLRGYFEYNTELFDAETIDLWIERLRVLLEGIAADPARRISQLPLLGEQQLRGC